MRIRIDADFNELFKRIEEVGQKVGPDAANDLVAKLSVVGRRSTERSVMQAAHLEMGLKQTTTPSRDHSTRVSGVFSRYDAVSGTHVSRTRRDFRGKAFKLSRFSWETKASWRKGKYKYALVSYTSTMANLWDGDTKPYTKSIRGIGIDANGIIKQGQVRKGRNFFFSRMQTMIRAEVPHAINTVERIIQKELDRV